MATPEKAESPEEMVVNTPAATKRKADAEEIEVDLTLPEPPSKRAKRALKKGKALPAKAADDDDRDDLDEADEKDTTEGKKRSEYSIWVGNLPFTLTALDLRAWLITNSGEIIKKELITRLKLPTKKDASRPKGVKPENRGFAYVDFIDQATHVAALALSESDLQGRKLLIKDAKSFEGRPAKAVEEEDEAADGEQTTEQKQLRDASRKVFVGNMSFKTTEEDVRRNFDKCGEIDWVKVATFEDTGKCKGYGWVKFREPEGAAWAVKGFVKIKEEVETEEDFQEVPDEDRKKRFKMRKWWVNKLLGRDLKLELAEDDQSRYVKRFKKGGPPREGGETKEGGQNREGGKKDGKGRFSNKGREQTNGGHSEVVKEAKPSSKPMKEAQDLSVARLTGAMVKPTGEKVTFDDED